MHFLIFFISFIFPLRFTFTASVLEREEAVFVMYYAPWCGQSMRFRDEFEKAAEYLQGQVQNTVH